MNKELIIRRYEDKDLDGLEELIFCALKTAALEKVYEPDVINVWKSYYSRKCLIGLSKLKHLYVEELEGQIVGCGAISLVDDMAYLSAIYIDPKIQGKGLGKKMIEVLEKDEIAIKTKKIFMHAALSANMFYQKLGYHYPNNIPNVIVDSGLDMIHLEKEL